MDIDTLVIFISVGAFALISLIVLWLRRRRFGVSEINIKAGVVEAKLKPDDPPPAKTGTSPSVQTPSPQPVERIITTEKYFEKVEHYHEAPQTEKPPSGSSFPRRERKFVQRGKVMDDARVALKKGSAAIVGVGGMGGVGKTELAKFLASDLKNKFDDVMWVDVNDRSIAIVQGEMARVLGIKLPDATDDQGRYSTLCAALSEKRWLIILDDVRKNFPLQWCLPPEPSSALITSRLHDLPHVNKTIPLDVMTEDQALELLRGEVADEVIDKEIEAAKTLCAACAHHPLALVLAAARLRKRLNTASPVKIYAESLKDRLSQLRLDQKDKDASLEANFDLSYDELDDAQKKRWRALAVFAPSGFALPAAAHLWSENETGAAEHLYDLENASMVEGLGVRVRLHDLLRDYAFKKLNQENESDAANRAHAEYLIQLFSAHYTDDPSTAPEVALEQDNLFEMAKWAHGKRDGDLLAALTTQSRNWFYVIFVNAWGDWFKWLNDSLQFGIEAKQLKANVLVAMGDVQQFRKELDAALKNYEQALKLFKEIGDKLGEANVLASQGKIYLVEDQKRAEEFLNQAIAIYEAVGSRYNVPAQIGNYGWALLQRGQKDRARPYLLKAAKLFEEIGLMDYAERHKKAAS